VALPGEVPAVSWVGPCSKAVFKGEAAAARNAATYSQPGNVLEAYQCPHWRCQGAGYWHVRNRTRRGTTRQRRKRARDANQTVRRWEDEGGASWASWRATGTTRERDEGDG
jgi:hypothetical protein